MVEVEVRDRDRVEVGPPARDPERRQHAGAAVEQQPARPFDEVTGLGAARVRPGGRRADDGDLHARMLAGRVALTVSEASRAGRSRPRPRGWRRGASRASGSWSRRTCRDRPGSCRSEGTRGGPRRTRAPARRRRIVLSSLTAVPCTFPRFVTIEKGALPMFGGDWSWKVSVRVTAPRCFGSAYTRTCATPGGRIQPSL